MEEKRLADYQIKPTIHKLKPVTDQINPILHASWVAKIYGQVIPLQPGTPR
jgi:hypothetical protein